jgi:hypothetical protein
LYSEKDRSRYAHAHGDMQGYDTLILADAEGNTYQ